MEEAGKPLLLPVCHVISRVPAGVKTGTYSICVTIGLRSGQNHRDFFRHNQRDQMNVTHDQAKRNLVDYIEMFYNSKRRHSYLDYMSPMEYEKRCLLKKAA